MHKHPLLYIWLYAYIFIVQYVQNSRKNPLFWLIGLVVLRILSGLHIYTLKCCTNICPLIPLIFGHYVHCVMCTNKWLYFCVYCVYCPLVSALWALLLVPFFSPKKCHFFSVCVVKKSYKVFILNTCSNLRKR